MAKIEVGDVACDMVTGFFGIVVARTEWLNGCARLTLQPRSLDDKGACAPQETFDELQCQVVERGVFAAIRLTGGPRPAPTRAKDPK